MTSFFPIKNKRLTTLFREDMITVLTNGRIVLVALAHDPNVSKFFVCFDFLTYFNEHNFDILEITLINLDSI